MKIFPEAEKMIIIAPRSKADAALDQLDRFASRIGHGTIPLSSLGPVHLPEGILEHLTSVTGARIKYNGSMLGPSPPLKSGVSPVANQKNSDGVCKPALSPLFSRVLISRL